MPYKKKKESKIFSMVYNNRGKKAEKSGDSLVMIAQTYRKVNGVTLVIDENCKVTLCAPGWEVEVVETLSLPVVKPTTAKKKKKEQPPSEVQPSA